jgi:hypothetical protein
LLKVCLVVVYLVVVACPKKHPLSRFGQFQAFKFTPVSSNGRIVRAKSNSRNALGMPGRINGDKGISQQVAN